MKMRILSDKVFKGHKDAYQIGEKMYKHNKNLKQKQKHRWEI